MRPIIGLTHSLHLDEDALHTPTSYPSAVIAAGGVPLILPSTTDPDVLNRYLDMVDGILFSGGDDINPTCYGEPQLRQCGDICPLRDEYELLLCRLAVERRKPVLGICRGAQLLNVTLGGTLYQDLPSQLPECIAHSQHQISRYVSHPVSIVDGSLLRRIHGSEQLFVNTFHHQAVKQPGCGLKVTALAPDGVIEAIELEGHPFCLGVQWHPERLVQNPADTEHRKLFQAFVDACR